MERRGSEAQRETLTNSLRESEERFRVAVENANDAVYEWDPQRGLQWFGKIDEMLGYALGEFPQTLEAWAAAVHPEDRDRAMAAVQAHLAEGTPYAMEYRVHRKNGVYRWWAARGAATRTPGGQSVRWVGLVTDITERKRTEEGLRVSETRYRRLFEAAKDGILILDAETGQIVDVNPFLIQMLGCSHEQLLGKTVWELGFFQDFLADRDHFLELQRQQYVRYENVPLETADGQSLEVEFVSNVYLAAGQRLIQCSIRDLTEHKREQEELLLRNLILSTQQETSLDGILVVDENGQIISSNRRFVELWGIPADIVESKSDARALEWTRDRMVDPEEFVRKVKHLYQTRDATSQDEIALKDGRTFDRYSAPMLGADGKYYGRVWYFRDITERQQAEEEREKLQTQLVQAQKMESVGRLAGGVAHDFNNMLTVILGYGARLLEKLPPADPLRGDAAEIVEAGQRSAALTRQLLAFSRRLPLQLEVLDLNDVVRNVEKLLRRLIGEDIECRTVLAGEPCRAEVDPGQIEQVLLNLAVNARDAMSHGGKLTLETALVELDEQYAREHVDVVPGKYVRLAVSDNGCGMDEATKQRVFEPFFTTKEKGQGTGLGLSTVYGIVKQLGGNINLYSEPGKGTSFTIYLPRTYAAPRPKEDRPAPEEIDGKGELILLAEDEAAVRGLLGSMLEGLHYQVRAVANGDEALRLVEYEGLRPALLLTDVVMPGMGGHTLVERLHCILPDLPVLYMSGYTDSAIVHHGVLDAGTPFIQKPFRRTDLAVKLKRLLRGTASAGRKKNILMIDDDEQVRALVELICRKAGHELVGVGSAAGALAALAEQSFDVLFVDVNMPGTDGAHVLRQIRAAGHSTPAIMLTGDLNSVDLEALRPLGVVNAIEKSGDTRPLVQILAELGG